MGHSPTARDLSFSKVVCTGFRGPTGLVQTTPDTEALEVISDPALLPHHALVRQHCVRRAGCDDRVCMAMHQCPGVTLWA